MIKQLQSHSTIRQYFGDVQKLQFVEQKMVGKSEIASFHIAGSKSNGTIGGEVKFRAPARFISVQGITDSGQRFKFDF